MRARGRQPFANPRNAAAGQYGLFFTGTLEHWTRDEVRELVERYGGRATSSVSGETD